jgi:cation transport ATPase
MKQIEIGTNLHCESCVTKLGKVLNNQPAIHHWKTDLNNPQKLLTVHGDLTSEELAGLLKQAGFEAVPEKNPVQTSEALKPVAGKFWRDKKIWSRASFNTFYCLVGCMIGDFAMIIYLQVYHPHTPMWLQMILAIIAGLITSVTLETVLMRYREKMVWSKAFKMAISMSFLSMIAMEIAMNATDFMITGGKADLSSVYYWLAFIPAAMAGFLTPLPYNYYQLKKHNHACH